MHHTYIQYLCKSQFIQRERKETLTSYGRDAGQGLEVGKQVNHGKISSVVMPLGSAGQRWHLEVVASMVVAAWFDLVSQPLCAGLLVFLGPMHKSYF